MFSIQEIISPHGGTVEFSSLKLDRFGHYYAGYLKEEEVWVRFLPETDAVKQHKLQQAFDQANDQRRVDNYSQSFIAVDRTIFF